MKKITSILICLLYCGMALAQDVTIIVNEQNPINEISQTQIQNLFLKKNRQWPNGQAVRFFDRRDDSAERKHFLRQYIKKTSRDIELYWIGQKLYSGNSAPIQVSTDSMMVSMVSRFPGAIGYVSSNFQGGPGVKKLVVRKE